MSGEERL